MTCHNIPRRADAVDLNLNNVKRRCISGGQLWFRVVFPMPRLQSLAATDGRQPDFHLVLSNYSAGATRGRIEAVVGEGYVLPDGRIEIVLGLGIVLKWDAPCELHLVPVNHGRQGRAA